MWGHVALLALCGGPVAISASAVLDTASVQACGATTEAALAGCAIEAAQAFELHFDASFAAPRPRVVADTVSVRSVLTWCLSSLLAVFLFLVLLSVVSSFVSMSLMFWNHYRERKVSGEKKIEKDEASAAEWFLFGEVYDLRGFLPLHPGGALVLEQCQGTDCSVFFSCYHTLRLPYMGVLKKYHLRKAAPGEADQSEIFEWKHTPAHDAMRASLRAHFQGKSHRAPAWALAWYAAWFVVLFVSTWRWLVAGELLAATLLGFAMYYGAHDMVHHAAHCAVFESRRLNQFATMFCGFWVTNYTAWIRQHNMLHHTMTNLDVDPDLHHFHFWYDELSAWLQQYFFGFNPWGSWRLTESTPMRSEYAKWWLIMPMYMSMSTLALTIIEPPYLFVTGKFMDSAPMHIARRELALGWLQFVTTSSVLLYVFWKYGMVVAMVPHVIEGFIFYVSSQLSHATDSSQPVVKKAEEVKDEWFVHQLKTTRGDYEYDSYLWLLLTQGLNLQSIHHSVPSVHWAHYPDIYRMVWAAGGEYREYKSIIDIVREHFHFISRLNTGPVTKAD